MPKKRISNDPFARTTPPAVEPAPANGASDSPVDDSGSQIDEALRELHDTGAVDLEESQEAIEGAIPVAVASVRTSLVLPAEMHARIKAEIFRLYGKGHRVDAGAIIRQAVDAFLPAAG